MENELRTRSEVQHLASQLAKPLPAFTSRGGARVRLGATAAIYSSTVVEMEGFARPLWGLAALEAGGGRIDNWGAIRDGLAHGVNPAHPEFWGWPVDEDQRFVELAAIAFAILFAPEKIWTPLDPQAKSQILAYLRSINHSALYGNNWLLFRVLINVCLSKYEGGDYSRQTDVDLNYIEQLHLGDGWYSDGEAQPSDHYGAFGFHFYCLLYATLADDKARAALFRDRAARFAQDYVRWFADDGSSLPMGRSLTYRFAQSAFWGALAIAGVQALPWGVMKGVVLRHLRWWMGHPILTDAGLLTIGYGYPNLNMAEAYNSPASPYWAFKAFLPLALPESHPFWASEEAPLPPQLAPAVQIAPRLVICRDEATDHVVALAAGQWADAEPRHVAEKYAKFCYSTHFAFSVPGATTGLAEGAIDSMLALSEDGIHFRVRRRSRCIHISADYILSAWEPWPDVAVQTWLVPAGAWHVRVHRVSAERALLSAEGGFALDRSTPHVLAECNDNQRPQLPGFAVVENSAGISGIIDLAGQRQADLISAAPNTNLVAPQTVIPTLVGRQPPGEYWLACAVLGRPPAADNIEQWGQTPSCTFVDRTLTLRDCRGRTLLAIDA